MNSTFRTIGKATADKKTVKVVGKPKLSLLREDNCCHTVKHGFEILNIFSFLIGVFLILNENLLVLNFLSRFFPLIAFI